MPVSKRNRVVALTKTSSKGRDLKTKMIDLLRESLDEYNSVYVLKFENMRAARFKEIRMHWKESRIFLGKNTVAQIALGKSKEDEYKDNLRHISKKLVGDKGLLFTNRPKKEVLKYFKEFVSPEYAKAGTIATEDIALEEGKLPFPISMMEQLRKLGLVVEVKKDTLELKNRFVCATKGVELTPEQAKVLVHINQPLIKFKIIVECCCIDGKYEEM